MKSLPQTSAQSLRLGKLWASSDDAQYTVLHGAHEMSKAIARRDLREALRFAGRQEGTCDRDSIGTLGFRF